MPYKQDGSILLEIFTHDGVGTMVVEDTLDDLRPANLDDVGAIVQLIEPLEIDGTLVPRGRSVIEREVEQFTVLEHDGIIYGCVALIPYEEDSMAEMACHCSPRMAKFGRRRNPVASHRGQGPCSRFQASVCTDDPDLALVYQTGFCTGWRVGSAQGQAVGITTVRATAWFLLKSCKPV